MSIQKISNMTNHQKGGALLSIATTMVCHNVGPSEATDHRFDSERANIMMQNGIDESDAKLLLQCEAAALSGE